MTSTRRVIIPLPDRDFDVTEVAVPWRLLVDAGHEVVFATERGTTPAADPLLLTGVIFGKLGAEPEPKRFYEQMIQSPAFQKPITWEAIDPEAYDGMVLPGGHAPGMRQYLGSEALQAKVAAFWKLGRPVGAICHGVLVLARAKDPSTGKSLLGGRRTTCLPKYMERAAYFLTAWKLGRYYRTYPAYVEEEVREALAPSGQFERGPREYSRRGTATDHGPAFVVEDGDYVSARWPGDAYLFTERFLAKLEARAARG
ncbi:ThiJ/PfpI family protein [Cystobacter fuscus]|uniref:ThiJ/PfpI family protein n=1 Tax=Cystobacter fuscus TaxID=43 RepID=A0A250JHQ7_9BACT|nr:type 1 glutamine amidotransferase domain-containing protein [Cystobacter fuscus]ATB43017.1 ThiJ/PfpI family protein [Cystobacter fuscus]